MVNVTYRKKGIRLQHIWFADPNELSSHRSNADLLFIHGSTHIELPHAVLIGAQHTLIKQLNSNPDTVYQTFGKHLRKFIQRSIGEGTTIQILTGKEISSETLDICLRLYNKMKEDKGLPGVFNTNLAKKYANCGNLLISLARIEGSVVGFKASIIDKHNLRGWVSAFSFRENQFDAQAVSRAHQLLEWETMQWCCKNGLLNYDFGGIYSFDQPNGIDKFKMAFAKDGLRVTYNNYLVGVSPLGKAAIICYNILKRK